MSFHDSTVIKKWGNSNGIILTKRMMEEANLAVNDPLEIEIVDNQIILRKAFKHKSFEERLAEYEGKIAACNYDWGEPRGRELL